MYKQYKLNNYIITLSLVNGIYSYLNILETLFNRNYCINGPKKEIESKNWLLELEKRFDTINENMLKVNIEYNSVYLTIKFQDLNFNIYNIDNTLVANIIDFPFNYILDSLNQIDIMKKEQSEIKFRLEQIESKLK